MSDVKEEVAVPVANADATVVEDKSAKSEQKQEKPAQQANPHHRQGGKSKKKKKKAKQDFLKTPKGTKDYGPREMFVRQKMFDVITTSFKKFGGQRIETPVFELKETLTGKYGEDSKLIYDLADQGGEICALRYDLTVPFARYVAMNGIKLMKRYSIARVYRRDQPVMTKGRYREFYQCDFDIAGQYDLMTADAECCAIIVDALLGLEVGEFKVKLNHRLLLDGILEICGVPEELFRPICSAIDKMDKLSWQEVKNEMVNEKGLAEESADKIYEFTQLAGAPQELLQILKERNMCGDNKPANQALDELSVLFEYLAAFGIEQYFSFDLSLARGLDYYTGMIIEATLKGQNVGSVAGGGRYDRLVGIFGSTEIPAVGFSLGIERLFTVLMKKLEKSRCSETFVYVASIDKHLIKERMAICRDLRAAGIASEMSLKLNPRIKPQLGYAEEHQIPYALVIGEREVENKEVQLKVMATRETRNIAREQLVDELKSLLSAPSPIEETATSDQ